MQINLKIGNMPCFAVLLSLCLVPILGHANEPYRGMKSGNTGFSSFHQLKQQGFISQKPQVSRMDYNDVYALKKPLEMFNQQVVLLSDEYMLEYVGCCVSEGWGAIIKKQHNVTTIQKFAQEQQCSFVPFSLKENLHYYGYTIKKLGKGEYYELSCRERDLAQE